VRASVVMQPGSGIQLRGIVLKQCGCRRAEDAASDGGAQEKP
jgi:hypothetical protein